MITFFIDIIKMILLTEFLKTMNADQNHLNDWFCATKLSLNTDKTKYVLLHKKKIRKTFLWFSQIYFLMILKSKEKTHSNCLELWSMKAYLENSSWVSWEQNFKECWNSFYSKLLFEFSISLKYRFCLSSSIYKTMLILHGLVQTKPI